MEYWKEETALQFVASLIWNTSEFLKIPLGRFAPMVFGWMIGHKGNKTYLIKKQNETNKRRITKAFRR